MFEMTVRNKMLIAVCNLKPVNMRGIKSHAMVLCVSPACSELHTHNRILTAPRQASSPEGKDVGVEICDPPAGSVPGDRVYFEGMQDKQPVEQMNPKKKVFETVQPGFTTLENRECAWKDKETGTVHKIVTDKGTVTAPTIVGGSLS